MAEAPSDPHFSDYANRRISPKPRNVAAKGKRPLTFVMPRCHASITWFMNVGVSEEQSLLGHGFGINNVLLATGYKEPL